MRSRGSASAEGNREAISALRILEKQAAVKQVRLAEANMDVYCTITGRR